MSDMTSVREFTLDVEKKDLPLTKEDIKRLKVVPAKPPDRTRDRQIIEDILKGNKAVTETMGEPFETKPYNPGFKMADETRWRASQKCNFCTRL